MNIKIAIKFTVVLLATFILLNVFLKTSKGIGNADEIALGKATTSVYADFDHIKIHCEGYSNSRECINSANKSVYLFSILKTLNK
jgi:hypothetical protein